MTDAIPTGRNFVGEFNRKLGLINKIFFISLPRRCRALNMPMSNVMPNLCKIVRKFKKIVLPKWYKNCSSL